MNLAMRLSFYVYYIRILFSLCLIICFQLLPQTTYLQSVYIVIHGTWGTSTSWYTPGGDFFDALEHAAKKYNAAIVPFSWSGKNTNDARFQAAQNLVKLIQTYEPTTKLYIIAHSHGGNIATLASQLLQKNPTNKYYIEVMYNLGTPITDHYAPAMDIIKHLYNFFSFEDLIQPVLGIFKREYMHHERIANIRIFINGKEPDHANLHSPLIASHIPSFHDWFTNEATYFSQPSVVYFHQQYKPVYKIDDNRKEMIERDWNLSALLINFFNHQISY